MPLPFGTLVSHSRVCRKAKKSIRRSICPTPSAAIPRDCRVRVRVHGTEQHVHRATHAKRGSVGCCRKPDRTTQACMRSGTCNVGTPVFRRERLSTTLSKLLRGGRAVRHNDKTQPSCNLLCECSAGRQFSTNSMRFRRCVRRLLTLNAGGYISLAPFRARQWSGGRESVDDEGKMVRKISLNL